MNTLNQEVTFCIKYNIDMNSLTLLRIILLAQNNEELELVNRYFGSKPDILSSLNVLQSSGIILKSFKVPNKGESIDVLSIPFNKNVVKDFHKASFDMGVELYEAYPMSIFVKDQEYKLRRISKKFNTLEDAYAAYGKAIKWNPETHKHVLELIELGKKTNYVFTTLGDFIVDNDWLNMESLVNDNPKSNITMI